MPHFTDEETETHKEEPCPSLAIQCHSQNENTAS